MLLKFKIEPENDQKISEKNNDQNFYFYKFIC